MRTEKFNLCKSTKKLLTLITLLTLGVGQIGAIGFNQGNIFFDATGWGTTDYVYFAVGKDSYTTLYQLNTHVENTNLYRAWCTNNGWWDGCSYFAVLSTSSSWGSGNWGYSNVKNASCYTGEYTSAYDINSGDIYVITKASSSNGAAMSIDYKSGITGLNSTQTVTVQIKTANAANYSNASKCYGTSISATTHYFNTAWNSADQDGAVALSNTTVTGNASAALSSTVSLSLSGTVTTGYQFDGWYYSDGTLISTSTSASYIVSAATTVYARFSEKMSTVTLTASPSDKGSFTIGGAAATSTSVGVTTTKSVTAVPASGYHFVSWAVSGGATISNTTDNPVTVTGTGAGTAATLTATFAADDVYTLTVAAGTGISSVSGTTNNIKAGDNIAIDATVASGYSWSTWTKTGSGSLSAYTAGTKSQTVTVGTAGDMTLTASATERMSTLTTSNHYDVGNPSYAVPTKSVSSIGIATTSTLTATAAGTGYTFAGWTLSSNLVVTNGDAATDRIITVRTNGNGADATAQANYTEDLTTTWYIAGDGNGTGTDLTPGSPFAGWGTSGTRMSKKTGHSTEEIYYCTITVSTVATTDDHFPFKVYNSTGTQYYGNSGYWVTKENNHPTLSSTSGSNMKFRPYVTGTYEFKLDNTGANPVLTVTWPVFNQVRISAVSPGTDATNVGNFDMSDPVSNVRTVTRSLKANTTYTFKIMYNSDWYGYNSGTFTRSTSTSSNSRILSTDGGNLTLTTDYAGDYTFRFNQSTKALSVDFPTAYKVTYGKGTVDGSSSSCSAKDIDNGNAAVTSNSTWVKSGNRVVLTAPVAKTGYTYNGWFDNNSGTGTAITTNANCTITVSSALTRYACYTINNHAITYTAPSHGSYTIKVGTADAVSANTTSDYGKQITLAANPATGYHFVSWSAYKTGTPATTVTVTSNQFTMPDYAVTVSATFAANTYSVTFDANGGTGDAMSAQAFTYDVEQALSANTYTRTGYNFGGWATSQANADAGTKAYDDGEEVSNLSSTNGAIVDLFAIWTPKNYTVTLDIDEVHKGTIDGKTTSQSVTYNAATSNVSKLPTAENGYGLEGYYTDQLGAGTKVIDYDGTWIASVTGYTDGSKNWVHDGDVTLYAYYKKAQITNIAFSPGTTVSPNATVTLTPTVSPAPTGATVICWKLLRNNGNLLSEEFTSNPSTPGNNVTFTAPKTSSSYKVAAVLRTGSGCGTGTKLDSVVYDLVVAGSHTVTIRYQDGSGRTIAASTETEGRPLVWSSAIDAASISGYTFSKWVAGDGVTLSTDGINPLVDGEDNPISESSADPIYIKATYDGTLTAVYNKKKMIFFNNTLNWDTVYVYFYKNSSYWDGAKGAGTDPSYHSSSYSGKHGGMTKIAGTSVYYFDAQAASADGYTNVAFTEKAQDNCWYFYDDNKVVRCTDYDATHLPMYVPLAGETGTKMNGNAATYYDKGYWMNYPENTGYWLKIYNKTATAGATKLYDLPFTFPDDHAMPLELAVDLEAGQTYGFEIARADGNNYRNTGTMTANTTNWAMTNESQYCGLQTTAAGEYIFRLAYFAVSSNYQYRVGVTYPVAVNDYRIVYTDGATWSKGAHGASWYHPSGVITKNSSATEVKNDTVSFFWSYGSSPAIAYQTCSAVAAGSASWSAGTSINVSSYSSVLTEAGVYNFIFQQPAGGASISLVKVEPYSGNYYIRTDCAGSTKWVNYRALDHQMTYSDYAEANSGYSHYFCHWVTTGTNVKFVIANDYSACISDTLSEDYGVNKIANITAEGNEGAGTLNSGNASIRFMWNKKTNVINRAYISGSSNVSDRFLILEGDAKLYDENGNSYSITGLNANEVNLIDDQNFVYERTIKVNATAKAKLTAKYNNNVQYFKGSEGAFAEGTTVQLLGGTYDAEKKYSMRLVYDFKTDRLVTAYIPEGTVDAQLNIQADLMIIREHQEAGQQLLFSGSGALKEVQSVYGVMRFNRWTLNNRQHPEDHDKAHCWNDALITTYHPLLGPGNVKSIYERALYWISFPFDVNLSDVFGFGTYGTHWIIMKYNGAQRATDGYWKDSEGFWEYIWDRSNVTLEKGKGYVLALELELMQATDSVNFWTHQIQEVELFFPSASTEVGTITRTSVDVTVPPHECTIDRRTKAEKDAGTNNWDKDRTIADSHWNIIGVPSYANYGSTLTKDKEGTQTITWNSNPKTQSLPFLYEWNASDNTYTVQSGTTYNFKAMHAYYVQYTGNLHWTLASATPPSIVARRTYAEAPESIEMKIELQQNETMIDQTFVKLSNDENVSAGFAFGEDLNKEKNAGKANIYTFIDNYMPTAGNTMPMIDQTTFIPVGVSIPTAGEYTFAIPEGTDGVGVFLIDNVANTRTNLSALDYTINLTTGTHDGRFILEISPIHNATTDIEAINDEGIKISGARKVLIDGILYIVKGDKLYDVRGTMIK